MCEHEIIYLVSKEAQMFLSITKQGVKYLIVLLNVIRLLGSVLHSYGILS